MIVDIFVTPYSMAQQLIQGFENLLWLWWVWVAVRVRIIWIVLEFLYLDVIVAMF